MHQQGESPGEVTFDETTEIVHPDRCRVAYDVAGKFNAGQLATIVWGGDLRLIDGHDGREHANAHTCSDTPDKHHQHTVGQGLACSTNEEYAGAIEDGLLPANDITDPTNDEGRTKRADFEDGNHGTNLGSAWLVEGIFEVRAPGRWSEMMKQDDEASMAQISGVKGG